MRPFHDSQHLNLKSSVPRCRPWRALLVSLLALGSLSAMARTNPLVADGASEEASSRGATQHVILIGGISRDPEQLRDKAQAITRLHRFFKSMANVPTSNLQVYTAPDSLATHLGRDSSKANITNALDALVKKVRPSDHVLLYYVGQANITKEQLRFNLPGPDLTQKELGSALAPLKAEKLVVILDCPGAGLALKALAGPNRILIAAARSDQPFSTNFSSYFVPALANPEGDFDKSGRTSLLESFQMAAQAIDTRYRDQNLMKTETPILEDDNDGKPSQSPWRYAASGKDGKVAADYYLTQAVTIRHATAVAQDIETAKTTQQEGETHEKAP